jgi:hypothetical protein
VAERIDASRNKTEKPEEKKKHLGDLSKRWNWSNCTLKNDITGLD